MNFFISHELEGQSAEALVSEMSRRCSAKSGASAHDLFIRDLFKGEKSNTLGEFEEKSIKQTKFHKSQIKIINEGNMLTIQLKPSW